MRATARSLARSLVRAIPSFSPSLAAIKYIRANQDLIALSTANGHRRNVRFDDIISPLPASQPAIAPPPPPSRCRRLFRFSTPRRPFFLSCEIRADDDSSDLGFAVRFIKRASVSSGHHRRLVIPEIVRDRARSGGNSSATCVATRSCSLSFSLSLSSACRFFTRSLVCLCLRTCVLLERRLGIARGNRSYICFDSMFCLCGGVAGTIVVVWERPALLRRSIHRQSAGFEIRCPRREVTMAGTLRVLRPSAHRLAALAGDVYAARRKRMNG